MPDIDLHKIIQENDKKNIRKLLIAIAVTILLCILVIIIVSHRQDNVTATILRMQQDSLKAHDKLAAQRTDSLLAIRDTAISLMDERVSDLGNKKTSIIHIYDKKRSDLSSSPVDKQLEFFSRKLPPSTH